MLNYKSYIKLIYIVRDLQLQYIENLDTSLLQNVTFSFKGHLRQHN